MARADAALCGVTRLADVTGLDCIGMPVFQSVRPRSRALSVHQGKGLTRETAMLGALMEAVECHHAEMFAADRMVASYDALPRTARVPRLDDFASDRAESPPTSGGISWVAARRLVDGGVLWVPFDVVSLDCTWQAEPLLDKSSVGLAAHFHRPSAVLTALLEVIERDAEWVWRRRPIEGRSSCRLDAKTPPFPWFRELHARVTDAGLRLTLYQIPAVIALPVFICELLEPGAGHLARHIVYGSAAHVEPEKALLGSVVEAVQSRVTLIAGVRDDIYPRACETRPDAIGLALPVPAGGRSRGWSEALDQLRPIDPCGAADLAVHLARAGYPDAAAIDLNSTGLPRGRV